MVEDFSFGSYGDYSGVVFYGPPTDGFWLDRLAVSNRFMGPLFCGLVDRALRDENGKAPSLAKEWNAVSGWRDSDRCVLAGETAAEFAEALRHLRAEDVAPHCAGCTPDQCLRCASVIREFIATRLARGVALYIEDV